MRHASAQPLAGAVSIVTGGARGLGLAYVRRLAGLGSDMAVVDRDIDAASSEQVAAIATAAGVRRMEIECDLGDPAAAREMADRITHAWGRIDVLVCNAGGGVGDMGGAAASALDPSDTEIVLRRNLYSTIHAVVAVAPTMVKQRSGRIVTVSSHAGLLPASDGTYAHYAAAKAGVVMYTQCLAQDVGPFGIRANCLAPGNISTPRIMASLTDEQARAAADATALRRIGDVEDCARVVEFLATDQSSYVTGAVIPVDGGSLSRRSINRTMLAEGAQPQHG